MWCTLCAMWPDGRNPWTRPPTRSWDRDRQGRRVYYRRELPRLAEVDAWGWGDNIALGMLETGGGIEHTIAASGGTGKAFDGEVSSFYRHTYFLEEVPDDNILIADVGGTVWMDQMRIVSEGYVQAPTVRGYTMRGSSEFKTPKAGSNGNSLVRNSATKTSMRGITRCSATCRVHL